MLEKVNQKVQKGWSLTKRIVTLMMAWGLVFSLVTIGRLRVGFGYDDTLVFSTPAFNKAFKSGAPAFSTKFWSVVNQSYDLEDPKILPNLAAWILRVFGFKITILAARPDVDAVALKKEWRHLANRFVFVDDPQKKREILGDGRYVLYFGNSDADITEGRLARVLTLRVKRSPKSSYKEDYHPGTLGEWVIPLSEY